MTPKPIDPTVPRAWAVVFCVVLVTIVTTLVVSGPGSGPDGDVAVRPRWAALVTPATARARLARLATVEPAWEVAYDRVRDFSTAWADVDHNGCDTRDDILRRDLRAIRTRPGTGGCVVVAGSLVDPYTGETLSFSKSDASAVQIDHVVPLHAAWILGAWRWPPARRLAFANDPRNLVAVDGPSNQEKGDRLADRWLPENERIHCVYAIDTVVVHAAYRLGVTRAERRALEHLLASCGRPGRAESTDHDESTAPFPRRPADLQHSSADGKPDDKGSHEHR